MQMTGVTTYQRRKALGVCPYCGGELDEEGRVTCTKCRQREKEWRDTLQANHICPSCKRNRIYGSDKRCPECRAYEANRRAQARLNDEKREIFNAQQRKSKHKREEIARQNGMCIRCHKRKSDNPNGGMCAYCKAKQRAYQRDHRSKERDMPERSLWVEMGLCYQCGSPNDNLPKHFCKRCSERNGHNFDGHRTTEHWSKQNRLIFKNAKVRIEQ